MVYTFAKQIFKLTQKTFKEGITNISRLNHQQRHETEQASLLVLWFINGNAVQKADSSGRKIYTSSSIPSINTI